MKRIEPVAWMCEYTEDGEVEREYNGHNEFSCGRVGNPLWTDDALQAVAEAVAFACFNANRNHLGNVNIDIAAIINQLKGQ